MSQAMNNGDGRPGHEQCGGRTRRGTPCRLPAGHGTGHPGIGRCDHHGGATPTHEEHARQVLVQRAEQAALAELAHLDVPAMGNPLEQLARLTAEAREWTDMLRERVAELTSLTGPDHLGDERARVVVVLLERAMDRLGVLCTALARLDIDDRLVAIGERIGQAQGEAVAAAIERILAALGHADPHHDPAVAPVVARELRAIGPGDG